jgi:hypothetical protein
MLLLNKEFVHSILNYFNLRTNSLCQIRALFFLYGLEIPWFIKIFLWDCSVARVLSIILAYVHFQIVVVGLKGAGIAQSV